MFYSLLEVKHTAQTKFSFQKETQTRKKMAAVCNLIPELSIRSVRIKAPIFANFDQSSLALTGRSSLQLGTRFGA